MTKQFYFEIVFPITIKESDKNIALLEALKVRDRLQFKTKYRAFLKNKGNDK